MKFDVEDDDIRYLLITTYEGVRNLNNIDSYR